MTCRLPRIALKWMLKQKRARGRPKKNWLEGIKKAMNERNLNEGQWEDRKQWSLGVGQRRKTFWNRYIHLPLTCLLKCLSYGVKYITSSTQVLDPYLKSSLTERSQPITLQTDAHSALGRPKAPSPSRLVVSYRSTSTVNYLRSKHSNSSDNIFRHSHITSVYNTPLVLSCIKLSYGNIQQIR